MTRFRRRFAAGIDAVLQPVLAVRRRLAAFLRPPLVFTPDNASMVLEGLDRALARV